MKRYFFILFLSIASTVAFSQTGQLTITRVTSMPNMPSPYIMRDWKNVALGYDSLVYNLSATGQYLPLMHLQTSGFNYPSVHPILFDSYVGAPGGGSAGGAEAEAINIIPSIVGASLVGADKSNQFGNNWVLSAKDFFNKANGQNVYLNGNNSGSGSDWWYDLMPNVFFYQLYSQYPGTSDFEDQFISIADRELSVVTALGGSTTPWTVPQMNYRGFSLSSMTPNPAGVTEPESAGTIAWILYHAYIKTGNKKYLDGAQLAITFLSNFTADPAYEIQLPYGTFIAAKMNAELGTTYKIPKMVNWSFDQSSKRNWGTVVGTWGDGTTGPNDVSGLVGEIDNPNTGYAFTMNGFEQASALVPMVKYDKRFAHDIAKWALNVANASRLFYSTYLPATHQDDFAWTSVHDPRGLIAYEALKQNNGGVLLYATGDAERGGWAATNLGLYGSSHVGYLGAIVQKTDVDGILLLNVNKTDFFGQNAFPSYLIYNPYSVLKQVNVPVGATAVDIYDAVSQTTIKTGVSGNVLIDLDPNVARLLVYLPAGTATSVADGKLMAGTKVVDYSYGYNFAGELRIRSLGAADTTVGFNESVKVYSSVEHRTGPTTFNWYANGTLITSSADSTLNWTVPSLAGPTWLTLKVTSGASTAKDSILFNVLTHLPNPPILTGITADSLFYYTGVTANFICHRASTETGKVTYTWTVPTDGSILLFKDSLFRWSVPQGEGLFTISCKVTNSDNLSTTASYNVLVKNKTTSPSLPLAYYSLDGDTKDHSGNGYDATSQGVVLTSDVRGIPGRAYLFSKGADIIDVPNATTLNFQDKITLSCWVNLTDVEEESFVISHGSYEQRYKVSIIPGNKVRWTIKTTTTTTDLDSSFPLQIGKFYHLTMVYSGYSMELYVDGLLDTYVALTGLMGVSNTDITFGRKDNTILSYHLQGTLDEVRIYDKSLNPDEIGTLKSLFSTVTGLEDLAKTISVYPNPAHGVLYITGVQEPNAQVAMVDMMGRKVSIVQTSHEDAIRIDFGSVNRGLLLVRIETSAGVVWRKVVAN